MKIRINTDCWSIALLALLSLGTRLSAQSFDVILPTPPPNSLPAGLGRTLLVDPFDSSPTPGILLGTKKYSADANVSTIYKLTPVDATYSSFNIHIGLLRILP
jgi:hypothetical protein